MIYFKFKIQRSTDGMIALLLEEQSNGEKMEMIHWMVEMSGERKERHSVSLKV